jgi:Zn-dependent peptidase ImmA (M78 family)
MKYDRIDWDEGDKMIREGVSDIEIAEHFGCSKSTVGYRRKAIGMMKNYVVAQPHFDYKSALENCLKELHQKYFPWGKFSDFLEWIKTDRGQEFLDMKTNQCDPRENQNYHAIEFSASIFAGRIGRYSPHA